MNNLAAVRKQSGKTQTEVAEFCGTQKSSVSTWEHARELPAAVIPKLMEYFRCSLEDLVGGSELDQKEACAEYRTNPVLRMMTRSQLLELLKSNVDKLCRAEAEQEQILLDASEVLIKELRWKAEDVIDRPDVRK